MILTDAELAAAAPHRSRTIDIEAFVDLADVDPIYFDHPYVLMPSGEAEGIQRAYRLLVEVMEPHRPRRARPLRHAHEGVPRADPRARRAARADHAAVARRGPPHRRRPAPTKKDKPAKKEVDAAVELIESFSCDWDPSRYEDSFQKRLTQDRQAQERKGQDDRDPGDEGERPPRCPTSWPRWSSRSTRRSASGAGFVARPARVKSAKPMPPPASRSSSRRRRQTASWRVQGGGRRKRRHRAPAVAERGPHRAAHRAGLARSSRRRCSPRWAALVPSTPRAPTASSTTKVDPLVVRTPRSTSSGFGRSSPPATARSTSATSIPTGRPGLDRGGARGARRRGRRRDPRQRRRRGRRGRVRAVVPGGHFAAHGMPSGRFAAVDPPGRTPRRNAQRHPRGPALCRRPQAPDRGRDDRGGGRPHPPVVGQTFPLASAADAHAAIKAARF